MNSNAGQENNALLSRILAGKGKTTSAGSWAHSVLDEKGALVLITSQTPDGRKAFYFLLLSRPQRNDLKHAMETRPHLDLEEFGKIVHSGWGEPGEADYTYMREHFNAG